MREASARRDSPVALFDSGAGGISVLREVIKELPCEHFFYFGDSKNAPYGNKDPALVRALILSHATRLLRHSKALVLACNTATALAADILRARFPDVPIIGMEPALRPAVQVCPNPLVVVLATPATLHEQKFARLLQKEAKNATVMPLPAPKMVTLVEKGLADSKEMRAYLRALFAPLPRRPDALVLGCTHFPFARRAILDVLGADLPLFDGAKGTANELARRLRENDLLRKSPQTGRFLLTSSAPEALPLYRRLMAEAEHDPF